MFIEHCLTLNFAYSSLSFWFISLTWQLFLFISLTRKVWSRKVFSSFHFILLLMFEHFSFFFMIHHMILFEFWRKMFLSGACGMVFLNTPAASAYSFECVTLWNSSICLCIASNPFWTFKSFSLCPYCYFLYLFIRWWLISLNWWPLNFV